MSGGTFDYKQYAIEDIAEQLEQIVKENRDGFENNTLDQFKAGIVLLRMARIYTDRIDWLLAGDDSEDTFHERLAKELRTYRRLIDGL